MKILAVDIGNTSITFGVVGSQKIEKSFSAQTHLSALHLKIKILKGLKSIKCTEKVISNIIVCSVVPTVTARVCLILKKELNILPKVIGRQIKVPIINKYRNPRQVGTDRLVGAYAARELYGAPLIIIDLGTAITFDLVNQKGEYEGGMIVPGIQMSAQSLSSKAAMLPRIDTIKVPKRLIGKDTKESILSGIFNGYGVMCCGLIDRISKSIKGKPKVIVTGGYIGLMKKFIEKKITKVEPQLVLKGLALLNDQ